MGYPQYEPQPLKHFLKLPSPLLCAVGLQQIAPHRPARSIRAEGPPPPSFCYEYHSKGLTGDCLIGWHLSAIRARVYVVPALSGRGAPVSSVIPSESAAADDEEFGSRFSPLGSIHQPLAPSHSVILLSMLPIGLSVVHTRLLKLEKIYFRAEEFGYVFLFECSCKKPKSRKTQKSGEVQKPHFWLRQEWGTRLRLELWRRTAPPAVISYRPVRRFFPGKHPKRGQLRANWKTIHNRKSRQ